MAGRKTQLLLLIRYLSSRDIRALGCLHALFTIHAHGRPLSCAEIFDIPSGYRRQQLKDLQHAGLLKKAHSRRQSPQSEPHGYALAAKGSRYIANIMEWDAPGVSDSGHLARWLALAISRGATSMRKLEMLFMISETPGKCSKELFTYRSGANNMMFADLELEGLVVEKFNGQRHEKYPGPRWKALMKRLQGGIPARSR